MSEYVNKLTAEVLDRLVQDHDDINAETFMALFQALAVTAVASTDGSPDALRNFFSGISDELAEAAIEVRDNMKHLIKTMSRPSLRVINGGAPQS